MEQFIVVFKRFSPRLRRLALPLFKQNEVPLAGIGVSRSKISILSAI